MSSNTYSEFIRSRFSPRAFLPDPVPAEVIKQVLIDAQSAPSNSNTQPWIVHLFGGDEVTKLSEALLKQFDSKGPTPDFTTDYGDGVHKKRSQELGAKMYGMLGVERDDKEGRIEFIRENLRFFGAPNAAMLFIPALGDRMRASFDQGAFVENFLLSLRAHGYDGIPQGMPSLVAPAVREHLGLSDDYQMVAGIAFGKADKDDHMHKVGPGRAPLSEMVTVHGIDDLELD